MLVRTLTKVYSQRDPQWALQRLGTVNGSTIGAYGCYVTSFAMIAEYYGKNVNPAQLDDFFTNGHVYYNADGSHNDPANYSSDNMLQVIYGDIVYQKTYDYANSPADLNLLKTLLSDPTVSVILEVDFDHDPSDDIQTHFIVAVGCDGSKIIIADPWYGTVDDFTKNYGTNPGQTILKFVVYKGPISSTPSPQPPTGGGNNYKGYDLSNPDSMKVAVDVLVRVQAGEFVEKSRYDTDIKAKDSTISSLNSTISTDNTTIKTQQAQIDAFPAQLKALQDQIDALQPQSDELVKTKELLKQAETDKESLQKENKTLVNSNAQLKNTSYTTADTATLTQEIIRRIFNRATFKN